MNISFDLDNTLIPFGDEFPTENRSLFLKLLGVEKIRSGSKKLIHALRQEGHHIHIYTTSFRSTFKIWFTFKCYGIRVGKIVNEKKNQRLLKNWRIQASKYPKAFNFDVHVDDSRGVEIEGQRLNFRTIIINPSDKNWMDKIKQEVSILEGEF